MKRVSNATLFRARYLVGLAKRRGGGYQSSEAMELLRLLPALVEELIERRTQPQQIGLFERPTRNER